jgi:predicted DNA-binding protein (UPF0251 family)
MDTNLARMFLLFYYLSDSQKHTAEELSDRMEVSKRTINNDVKGLENYALYHGAKLIRDHEGYHLEVFDAEEFAKTRNAAIHSLILNPIIDGHVESTGRPFDILRVMFATREKMTLDDVAEALFVSKESFKKDYKKAKMVLASYNLQYNAYNRNETNITGREFDLRMCMLYLYHPMHQLRPEDMFIDKIQEFYDGMQANKVVNGIRNAMICTEIADEMPLHRANIGRIRGYLNLSENRLKKGYHLNYSEEDRIFLRGFHLYDVADRIVRKSLQIAELPYEEEETYGLEQFLLMYLDIDGEAYEISDYYPIYQEAENMTWEISKTLEEYFGVSIGGINGYKEKMIPFLIPFMIQLHFQAAGYFWNYIKVGDSEKYGDPLGNAMGLWVKEYLHQKYGYEISRNNVSKIARHISCVLSEIEYHDKNKKILVYSSFGMETARDIASKVKKVLPSHLKYEWYLMKEQSDIDTVDLAIVQSRNLAWYPANNVIYVDLIPSVEQLLKISSFFLYKKTGPQMFYSIFHQPPVIEMDYVYQGKEAFVSELVDRLAKEPADLMKKQMRQEYLMKCDFFACYNGCCVLILDKDFTEEPVFLVYTWKNQENTKWNGRHINSILVLRPDLNGSLDQVKYLRDYLQALTNDREILERFLQEGDPALADSKVMTV